MDENGEPIPWRLRVLTEKENNQLRNQCRRKVTNAATKQTTTETDVQKYNDLLAEKCIAYPNLNDAELQESYGVIGAAELLKIMLLPGEYADLMQAISQANGFESGMADKIRRVKN